MGVFIILRFVVFILFSGIFYLTRSEVYTSLASIEPLLVTQRELIKSLESYINTGPENEAILTRYLLRYQKEDEIATKDATLYLGNPINCYTLIKRLTRDLYFLVEKIINNKTVFKTPVNVTYPDKEDFDGALWSVARLHTTYRINVTEWAGGVLNGHFNAENQTRTTVFTPMSSSDCFEIGRGLYGTQEYLEGLSWMLNALRKYTEDDIEMYDVSKATIVEFITFGYYKLDYVEKIIKWTKRLIALAPHDHRVSRHVQMIDSYQNRLDAENRKRGNERKIESKSETKPMAEKKLETAHFETLCRGEVKIPQQIANRLRCRYMTETHPFLRLAPIKMEQKYLDPDIVMLYDVMSDDEIEYLRNISLAKLSRGGVFSGKTKQTFVVPTRICKTAFHSRSESRITENINRRTNIFTGLNMDTAEMLHVANYGIGGHYEPHFDAVQGTSKGFLNRIATVLFYMSDVTQGGATVFLHLGLTVYPVRGAALFWMNLHPSCELDYATRHAACPVLEGSKWVCSVWLTQLGQELLRPCKLKFQDSAYHRNLHRPVSAKYYHRND